MEEDQKDDTPVSAPAGPVAETDAIPAERAPITVQYNAHIDRPETLPRKAGGLYWAHRSRHTVPATAADDLLTKPGFQAVKE